MPDALPRLFIGSSTEGLETAYDLQEILDFEADVTVWTQDVFRPTSSTLESLERQLREADFAALVFTADDLTLFRGETKATPRDNVVFELGLFIGALGRDRCSFLTPVGSSIRLPTDLLGLAAIQYRTDRADRNSLRALGPAANQIRRMFKAFGPRSRDVPDIHPMLESVGEYLRLWSEPELADARELLREGIPNHIGEDEDGNATAALRKVFSFLDGVADAVLSGRLDEQQARAAFKEPMHSVWQHAATYFPYPGNVDDAWNPLPSLAVLSIRWSK